MISVIGPDRDRLKSLLLLPVYSLVAVGLPLIQVIYSFPGKITREPFWFLKDVEESRKTGYLFWKSLGKVMEFSSQSCVGILTRILVGPVVYQIQNLEAMPFYAKDATTYYTLFISSILALFTPILL